MSSRGVRYDDTRFLSANRDASATLVVGHIHVYRYVVGRTCRYIKSRLKDKNYLTKNASLRTMQDWFARSILNSLTKIRRWKRCQRQGSQL